MSWGDRATFFIFTQSYYHANPHLPGELAPLFIKINVLKKLFHLDRLTGRLDSFLLWRKDILGFEFFFFEILVKNPKDGPGSPIGVFYSSSNTA